MRFVVPGRPVPWQRVNPRKGGVPYNAPAAEAHKRLIRLYAMQARAQLMEWDPTLSMKVDLLFDYKNNQTVVEITPIPSQPRRADVDNASKLVLDALQDDKKSGWRGLYRNDHQVKDLHGKMEG